MSSPYSELFATKSDLINSIYRDLHPFLPDSSGRFEIMEETEYNIIIKQHSEYPYFSMNRGKNHKFDIVWNLEIGWFLNRIHAAEIEIKE